MPLDAPLDLYALKRSLERVNELIDLGAATADLRFLRTARRALLPLPLIDRPQPVDTRVFRRFRDRPAEALDGRRVAVVATGGGGGALAMAGVARAFEEAHVRAVS